MYINALWFISIEEPIGETITDNYLNLLNVNIYLYMVKIHTVKKLLS